MAPALRVGIDKLRFVSQDIGGGFGNKITLHRIHGVLSAGAELNRPVQWTEWRTDQHTANTHGNERTFLDVTVPVKADGTMLASRSARSTTVGVPPATSHSLHHLGAGNTGLLPLAECARGFHAGLHEQVARGAEPWLFTHAAPLADRAESSTSFASELGLDPIEVRKKNYVKHEEFRMRRRTAASTTRATTPAAWTSRSS